MWNLSLPLSHLSDDKRNLQILRQVVTVQPGRSHTWKGKGTFGLVMISNNWLELEQMIVTATATTGVKILRPVGLPEDSLG